MEMRMNWQTRISQPRFGLKEERNQLVAMRDGTRLACDVFRPDAGGKFPAPKLRGAGSIGASCACSWSSCS